MAHRMVYVALKIIHHKGPKMTLHYTHMPIDLKIYLDGQLHTFVDSRKDGAASGQSAAKAHNSWSFPATAPVTPAPGTESNALQAVTQPCKIRSIFHF